MSCQRNVETDYKVRAKHLAEMLLALKISRNLVNTDNDNEMAEMARQTLNDAFTAIFAVHKIFEEE